MQHLHPVSSNEPKSSILLFSLLSPFLKEKKVPSHTSLPGGKEKIMVWTRRRLRKFRLAGKQTTEKLSCQSLSNQFLNFELSSSNDPALYGKPVRGGTDSWLVAPLLCFESAQ